MRKEKSDEVKRMSRREEEDEEGNKIVDNS